MTSGILVAGIGNIFLGDDAFGVEVARALVAAGPSPPGVTVEDYGIRGFDLAFALMADWDLVILVDAYRRGETPGTLCVLEPEPPAAAEPTAEAVQGHGLTPERVLGLVRALGGELRCPLRVVGCEPASFGSEEEPALTLSAPVRAAVEEAVRLVQSLIRARQEQQPAVTPFAGGFADECYADGP